jgi:CheY-like chemotaxis protein
VTKVLYVEHNDDNLYMLKTRLELRGGFEVLAAEDSEKGCRLAATEHPDLILMDLEMPDDDRWEAVQERSANPGHPDHRHVRACRGERAREAPQGATSSMPNRSNSSV